MDIKEKIKQIQEESEATRDLPLPEGVKGERRTPSVVQSVRLPVDDFAEIERLAHEAGVPVSALLRGWILSGLAAERGSSLKDAIDRLVADADQLRRIADRSAA